MNKPDSHEVARLVVMALVLEPLSEKEGCTTRSVDLKSTIKLQHLQAAGVNAGRYFYEIAERVRVAGGQPDSYFDVALEALDGSIANLDNSGKLINQGLIAMMSHVVVASLLVAGDGVAVCEQVPEVLKNSSAIDGQSRNQFRQQVVATSRSAHKRSFPSFEASSLADWYEQSIQPSRDLGYESGAIWAEELLSGLPLVQKMYMEARKYTDQGLLVAMEKSFELGTELLPIESPGFVADYVGLVAYLLLRDGEEGNLIK
jgi:hypothetical protein